MLVGRDRECARIDAVLAAARAGRAGSVLFRGAAGSGKTSLLAYATERADGLRVLAAVGIEAEAELEFSALLELCRPVLGELERLPDLHADALMTALGLRPGESRPDRFTIGLATLALLSTVAETGPLLLVCDDVQWIDRSSRDALTFAVRRLDADAVGTIFAARPESAGASPLGEHVLEGLDAYSVQHLLARNGASVAAEVASELTRRTGGNPLALHELGNRLTLAQLAGTQQLAEDVLAGTAADEPYRQELDALPASCLAGLLLAAISFRPELRAITRAMTLDGLEPDVLEPAEDAALLAIDGDGVTFAHPLVRSAVVASAAPSARRAAHATLAAALETEADEDAAAWHRAAAALAPAEEIAAGLDGVAARALARGGFAGAAAALRRAAELTPDAGPRVRRQLGAAEAAWNAGDLVGTETMLSEPLAAVDPGLRANALRLRGAALYVRGEVADGASAFLDAAELLADADPETAMAIAADAVNGRLAYADPSAALAAADAVVRLAHGRGRSAEAFADVTRGHALCFGGRLDEGRDLLERGLRDLDGRELRSLGAARIAYAYAWLGRENDGLSALARAVAEARAARAIGWLPYVLATSGWHDVRVGELQRARAAATEAIELASEVGQPVATIQALMVLMWLAALRGDGEELEERAAEVERATGAYGFDLYALLVPMSRGLFLLAAGRVEEAVTPLEGAAFGSLERGFHIPGFMPVFDLAEGYIRVGRGDDAAGLLDRFSTLEIASLPLERAAIARCRGLLAADDGFEPDFLESLELHRDLVAPLERARTQLCLGERLRRAGRRVDCRAALREALAGFERLGAATWAERARAELRASGETLRRDAAAGDELTPQELRIALQVADGKTNREVASSLFLSPKTIEFHLARVFRKLGVSSRRELTKALADSLAS